MECQGYKMDWVCVAHKNTRLCFLIYLIHFALHFTQATKTVNNGALQCALCSYGKMQGKNHFKRKGILLACNFLSKTISADLNAALTIQPEILDTNLGATVVGI